MATDLDPKASLQTLFEQLESEATMATPDFWYAAAASVRSHSQCRRLKTHLVARIIGLALALALVVVADVAPNLSPRSSSRGCWCGVPSTLLVDDEGRPAPRQRQRTTRPSPSCSRSSTILGYHSRTPTESSSRCCEYVQSCRAILSPLMRWCA